MEFETENLNPDLTISNNIKGLILWRYEGMKREIRHLRYFRDCKLTMDYQEISFKDHSIPYHFDFLLETTDIFGSAVELDIFRRSILIDGKKSGKAEILQLCYENGQLVISGVVKMAPFANYSQHDGLLFQGLFSIPQEDVKDFKIKLLNMRNKMRLFEDKMRVV